MEEDAAVEMTERDPLTPSPEVKIDLGERQSTAGKTSEHIVSDTENDNEKKIWKPADFKRKIECKTFIEDSSSDGRCQCGRPRHKHPTDTAVDTAWTSDPHNSELPTDAFGELWFEGDRGFRSFLRLSSDTKPSVVYDLMTRDRYPDDGWSFSPPFLVASVVGGDGRPEVKTWVQKVIRQLVKTLDTTGRAWILTEGFDKGLGRCVGDEMRGYRGSFGVRAVGITPWGFVHNKHHLVSQGRLVQYSIENTTSDSCCLDKNHDAFLLVDDGREGRKGGEKSFRVKLEEDISTQNIKGSSSSITIPFLCMLIAGEPSMLERVGVSLKNSTPWLVLAGSGGVADLLCDILENQSPAYAGDDVVRVTELIRKHFPFEAQTDELVEQVRSITRNRKLITFYHEEQERPEDFDAVMIKALMPASKHLASGNTFAYGGELFLAMLLNRLDIASTELFNDSTELFNDDINRPAKNLEFCMTTALVNDKVPFVRLFIEKKFQIQKYLTYGLLETLYSTVDCDTLVYRLLEERLKQRLGTSDSLKEISLFEVSGILKKFIVEEKPFYFSVLGLEDFTSDNKKALEPVRKLLKRGNYREKVCEKPFPHLFIWAVLQNHSDMAVFFWEKAEDSVMNALSACKMLREMSKMEIETETKHSMKKLAQKFEDKAHGMLSSCYQSNESHSFELLTMKSPVWNTNCFQIGIAVESHLFFDHDGLENVLSKVWWGDMEKGTTVWKVLLTLFCPPLCCTNLISYREDKEKQSKHSSVLSRWHQFWSAPVTTFLGNAVMYFPFLFLFAYVLLVDFKPPPPSGPSISECVLYFYVFTFLCEEIYEAFFMRNMTSLQRLKLYVQDVWNMYDFTAILLFIIGVISRMFKRSYEFGRCVLCIDYMVFTLRLIHIFAVNKQMGPKIIIVGKMMKDVFSFIFFLGVWIMAYGVANQALLYEHDSNIDRIFRRVFYRPYLHIFGHFPVEEVDVGLLWVLAENCTANVTLIDAGAEPCRSEYNNWLVIILLVVFLLVTNILLINLLIAMLTKTFEMVQEKSDLYWKFQHYNLIVEYQSRPAFPPPFIILYPLYLFIPFLKKIICREPTRSPLRGLEEALARAKCVKGWETELKKKFLSAQSETKNSDSERIKQISDKVENVLKKMTETRDTDERIKQISDKVDRVDNVLKQLTEQLTETTVNLNQRQRALETKVENALSQILDTLAKAPWTKPPST